MAWTTPRTWTVGETVTKAILDVHVRDNLQYLKDVLDGVQSQAIVLTNAVRLSSSQPSLIWEETDSTTDNKRAHLVMASGNGSLRLQFLNDAGSGGGNYLDFTRVSNNSLDDVQFYRGGVLTFEIAVNDQQLRLVDGSVGTPALGWISDPDTGLYRIGANNIGVALGGVKVLDLGGANAALEVLTTSTTKTPLRVSGYSGMSAAQKIFDVRDSGGTSVFYVTNDGSVVLSGTLNVADGASFDGGVEQTTPVNVTGATGGNAALQNLIAALVNLGLISDSTT